MGAGRTAGGSIIQYYSSVGVFSVGRYLNGCEGHEDAVSSYTYFITVFIYFQNTCNLPVINIRTSYEFFYYFKYKVTSLK